MSLTLTELLFFVFVFVCVCASFEELDLEVVDLEVVVVEVLVYDAYVRKDEGFVLVTGWNILTSDVVFSFIFADRCLCGMGLMR